nr:hypothetical protein CFP56_26086 [Quercus suber]
MAACKTFGSVVCCADDTIMPPRCAILLIAAKRCDMFPTSELQEQSFKVPRSRVSLLSCPDVAQGTGDSARQPVPNLAERAESTAIQTRGGLHVVQEMDSTDSCSSQRRCAFLALAASPADRFTKKVNRESRDEASPRFMQVKVKGSVYARRRIPRAPSLKAWVNSSGSTAVAVICADQWVWNLAANSVLRRGTPKIPAVGASCSFDDSFLVPGLM